MKKKVALVLVLLLAIGNFATSAFAADSGVALTPYVDKGELLVNAGIGWGGISGGAEYTFARIDIGGIIPITFGGAARAFVDPGLFYSAFSDFTLGVGGFGTAHVGFKDLTLPSGFGWFSNCDVYVGVGLGIAIASSTYYDFAPGIGISTFEGVAYYLNDKLALNFEFGYIGRVVSSYWPSSSWPLYYSTFGAILKI